MSATRFADAIIYIVDDDSAVREALSSLLRSYGMRVETFSDARSFLERERSSSPACLILDVRMPGISGVELQQRLKPVDPRMPIVFITGHGDIPMAVRAVKAGAVEFLTKPFSDDALMSAVKQGLRTSIGVKDMPTDVSDLLGRADSLTSRERELVELVVVGQKNKQIAARLHISEITVKVHRRNAMTKMGARSLAELVRLIDRLRPST